MPVSLKTRLLDRIRLVGMAAGVERVFVAASNIKPLNDLAVRLAPNNYQYAKDTFRECERGGVKYRLDISDYMQYCVYYNFEIEPRERLYELVEDAATILDIGTNIGETLLNFAARNRCGLNIGFEPVPHVFAKAVENIRLNSFDNIRIENLALSDSEAELAFEIENEGNSGGAYLSSVTAASDRAKIVKATTLDDFVAANELGPISLIKIDVEGFEMNVLRGAEKTIREFRPRMFIEVNDEFLRRQNSTAADLVRFLGSHGYDIVHAETGEAVTGETNFAGKHFDVICRAAKGEEF